MLDAVQALNALDASVFDASSAVSAPRDASDTITVPDAHLLFNGEFKRVGTSDLKIVGSDGKSFYIENYFGAEKHKHLMSPEGALLTANLVEKLAGPLAPGQHAQAGAQPAAQQTVIGRVDAASGSCTVVRNGVTVVLNVGDNVRKGDVVQTSGSSAISIVFLDGSTFSLNANARMVLDEFVYAAGANNNSAVISLVQGTFSFVAGQVAKTGDMKVETPVATMGIRGTAVLVEISANDGRTKFSVMVEPNGTTGSFNLYNKTTGALIATVNNSQVGWVVTPTGPLQVLAEQVNKSPAELAQELSIVQQLFTIFNNYQQNPLQDPERRGDNQNGPQNAGPGGSGTPVSPTGTQNGQQTDYTVTITQIGDPGLPGGGTGGTGGTGTGGTGTGTGTGSGGPGAVVPLPLGTFTLINGNDNGNTIIGTAGSDHIFGFGGNDVITALGGDDQVFGGTGDDTIYAAPGSGNDFYDGGEGFDTLSYSPASQASLLADAPAEGIEFHLRQLVEGVERNSAYSEATGLDYFINIEKIVGGTGDDHFYIHQMLDIELDGGAGIDTVHIVGALDLTTESGGIFAYNIEILDLNQDFANIANFEPADVWTALGLPDPTLPGFRDEGSGATTAMRVLGGSSDIISISNDYQIGGTGPVHHGHWELVHSYTAEQNSDGALFDDDKTDGIAFNEYQFFDENGDVLATVYIQNGVQIVLDNSPPDAGNVTILANALGNGGFDSNPDFLGWTFQETPGDPSEWDLASLSVSDVYIDRSGTVIDGDNAVAVLTFSGQVPERYGTGFGPSITSDVFTGYAGDTIRLVYQLSSGADQGTNDTGTVTARIIDVSTNPHQVIQEIFDDAPLDSSTGMLTFNVQLEHSGQFQIEFVVGSIDDTGGYVVGAELDIGFAGIIQNGISENTVYVIASQDLLANSTDPENDEITLLSVENSNYGAFVSINLDGSITYDPTTAEAIQALAAGESLTDTFTFTIRDKFGATDTATATITVFGVNDAPTTDDVNETLSSGASYVAINLAGADVDGNVAGFKLTALSLDGDLSLSSDFSTLLDEDNLQQTLSSNTVVYFRPNDGFDGNATFQYVAVDNDGAIDQTAATATIAVTSPLQANSETLNGNIPDANPVFTYNSDNGHWYMVNTTELSWADADAAATAMGGYLVNLTSAAENAFVAHLVTIAEVSEAWTGGSDAAAEGYWRWTSGPEAGQLFWVGDNETGQAHGYTNWDAPYEPNNYGGGYGVLPENHLLIRDNSNSGNWNDYNGDGSAPYPYEVYPWASVVEFGFDRNHVSVIPSAFLLANDVDGATINSVTDTANTHGTLVLMGNGNIQYTPDPNYVGEASFEYTIVDEYGHVSNAATVTFFVEPPRATVTVEPGASFDSDTFFQHLYDAPHVEGSVTSDGLELLYAGGPGTEDDEYFSVRGTGLTWTDDGDEIRLTGGTINGVVFQDEYHHVIATITGMDINAIDLMNAFDFYDENSGNPNSTSQLDAIFTSHAWRVTGGEHADILTSGIYDDVSTGGAGADTFLFVGGKDVITDFSTDVEMHDFIDVSALGIESFAEIGVSEDPSNAANTLIEFGGGRQITLQNVVHSNLDSSHFVYAQQFVI